MQDWVFHIYSSLAFIKIVNKHRDDGQLKGIQMFKWLAAVSISLLTCFVHAEDVLLSAEDAFFFSIESKNKSHAELSWKIPENYYLYKQQFSVKNNQKSILLKLPKAHDLYDENYGNTQVYFNFVKFEVPTQASQTYVVTWQGCAKDRICYPPQSIEFKTNIDGLVEIQNQGISGSHQKNLLDLANQTQIEKTIPTLKMEDQSSASTLNDSVIENTADDQIWSQKLASSPWIYGFILFFGLGVLLAFTPCSLPMLPILTSLIVRDQRGVKAWIIALVFVCSMASVYAILGLIASSAGLNFQRWLQQPSTLIAFSFLFILFALNLFGLFEIKLPQFFVHKLDQAQSVQKGGTLLGAGVMGMISALLVGPCMTAPLAGALLFISQTQNQWHGAMLLFTLGLGMGTPLLLASILGAQVLPKAGQWMNHIKVIFAFIMLGLALYFVRPLLSAGWLQTLSLVLELSFIIYILKGIYQQKNHWKWLYIAILLLTAPYVIYSQYQQSQRFFSDVSNVHNQWQIAHNTTEFEQLLQQAPKNKKIIIDVYADWCIACQPIENRVLKSAKVQQKLQAFYLIKLDLSDYDKTHEVLLKQWDILGPPTYLFLTAQQQEVRGLRLTGAFSEEKLLEQLGKLNNIKD